MVPLTPRAREVVEGHWTIHDSLGFDVRTIQRMVKRVATRAQRWHPLRLGCARSGQDLRLPISRCLFMTYLLAFSQERGAGPLQRTHSSGKENDQPIPEIGVPIRMQGPTICYPYPRHSPPQGGGPVPIFRIHPCGRPSPYASRSTRKMSTGWPVSVLYRKARPVPSEWTLGLLLFQGEPSVQPEA